MANATLPPPEIPTFNLTNVIGDFTSWWNQHTFNLFGGVILGLFVLSVFLKTRSLSTTLVAAAVAAAVAFRSWLVLLVALTLAGLLWALWERSGE